MSRPIQALLFVCTLPFLAACPPVAAGVVVLMSSQEFHDHAKVYHVTGHSNVEVWNATLAALTELTASPLDIDAQEHTVRGSVEGASIYVKSDVWDHEHTRLSIASRKFGVYENAQSDRIYERIRARLGE